VAYVLDVDGLFARRCNMGMVDLESLEDPDEIDLVQNLVMKHVAATGSTYVQRLLSDWASLQKALVKVMPREYKRALAQQQVREVATVGVAVAAVVAVAPSGKAARAAHG
jgi:glutamate synthase (NADPH) large chain